MYYVLASCEDLRTALMRLARYSALANEGVVVDFRIGAEITISFEYVGVARSSDRQQIEFFMMILVRLLRHLIGRNLSPVRAQLMHRRESNAADVCSLLGCAVEFSAATDLVVFPGDVKHAALKEADPYLNRMLLRFCDEMLSHRRVKAGDWRLKVENAIVPLLPHGEATIDNVARKLGVSERTLTRRLGREHTTFLDVRRELRQRLATQYLRDPETSMTRVAWLLGYRGSSAFSHAFKSWTGRTPRQTRARDRAAHF
jgi:AraC-like DNA-binding protein